MGTLGQFYKNHWGGSSAGTYPDRPFTGTFMSHNKVGDATEGSYPKLSGAALEVLPPLFTRHSRGGNTPMG